MTNQPILYSKIIEGNGPDLFIFHGLFGQSDNWNSLGKKYAENFNVHLIDLRNHGRSFHSDVMNYEAINQDFINYMAFHQIEKAHFLGHSLGGRMVMYFALSLPEKVDKLIVADMSPKSYPPHHQGIIKALNAVDFNKINNRSEVEEVLKHYIPEAGVRQFLLKNVYLNDDKKYAFRFNLKALEKNYLELVQNEFPQKTFEKPTLFLGGENSHYIESTDHELIKSYFPNAIFKTIKKAGHWLHAENPEDFFNETTDFLIH